MTKTSNQGQGQRLAWATPTLRRIEAGSAEAKNSGIKNDGSGVGGGNKS